MQLTHHIDDAIVPNITAARAAHNAQLPPSGDAAPGAANPEAIADNDSFLKFKLDELLRGFVAKYALLPPAPPPADPNAVPEWVTRKQGLKALARATTVGLTAPIYEADIQARIEAMPQTTPEEILRKQDMRIEFKDATTWRRGNVFFETMVAAMGISPEQRDALLRLAATFLE